jgi:hypothetical protein
MSSLSLLSSILIIIVLLILNVNSSIIITSNNDSNINSIINTIDNKIIARDLFVYQPHTEQKQWLFLYSMSEDATMISNNEKPPYMDDFEIMGSNVIYFPPLDLSPVSNGTFPLPSVTSLTFVTGKYI